MDDLIITIPDDNDISEDGKVRLFADIEKDQGIWRIHSSDSDAWLGNPHAARVDKPEILNLSDGIVYAKGTREMLYAMSKKTMRLIYAMIKSFGGDKILEKIEGRKSEMN